MALLALLSSSNNNKAYIAREQPNAPPWLDPYEPYNNRTSFVD
jgi:hypothetical protein